MYLRKIVKYFIFIVLVLFSYSSGAQALSYVYIQGDKQIPFYVKMEDQMQPRYGKNYCIISQLAPGNINVQILFQQNAYPPQKFTISVPEGGFRGFLLTRAGTGFSLYDIQQQFYLPSGNTADDDHVPVNSSAASYISRDTAKPQSPDDYVIQQSDRSAKPDQASVVIGEPANVAKNNAPQFIGDMELKNPRTIQSPAVSANSDLTNNISANLPAVPNSDCPEPMDAKSFEELYGKMLQKSDKSRLRFLTDKLEYCYTSNQVRMLTRGLPNDPERYAFLKQAYHRVTDQSNFPALENLLSTQEWKGYFRLIIP